MASALHRPDRRAVVIGGVASAMALAAGLGCAPQGQCRPATPRAKALVSAARRQIGVTVRYDPGYTALDYPGGDVPRIRGVCTDVVIRAYRDAFRLDLQELVHRDMAAHFREYPRNWGLAGPDRNIDHRRVPNLQRFWIRTGAQLPLPIEAEGWQPGDIFTALVSGLPHTGLVSDQVGLSGALKIIHNIGQGTQEEDALLLHRLTGRYRWHL